ncbi:hypothetical protein [Culicoidibacter larvae]|uniref:hypothetical protein n=1 Tax=Culicoidibacter larvae TaxID=2579976 RepID=UPI001485938B|nr:hypothetical protein [Culicoidibacter larvae]
MFIEYILAILIFAIPLYFLIRNRRKKNSGCDCSSKSEVACQSCGIPSDGHFKKFIDEKYPNK